MWLTGIVPALRLYHVVRLNDPKYVGVEIRKRIDNEEVISATHIKL